MEDNSELATSQSTGSADIGKMQALNEGLSNRMVESGDGGTSSTTSNTVDFAFAKNIIPSATVQSVMEVMNKLQTQPAAKETGNQANQSYNTVPRLHVTTTPEVSLYSPHPREGPSNSPNLPGNITPPARRSVQFVRSQTDLPHTRSDSWDGSADLPGKGGRGKLLSKLRAFTGSSTGHPPIRSPGENSTDERLPSGLFTPDRHGQDGRFTSPVGDESDIDADGELSTGEDAEEPSSSLRKRRKSRRPGDDGMQTAPVTPKTPIRSSYFRPHTPLYSIPRPSFLPRRATMTDLSADERGGVSEDEGRDRIARGSPWRRNNTWVHSPRGLSYSGSRTNNDEPPVYQQL